MVVWTKRKIARAIKEEKTDCLFNPESKHPLTEDRRFDITANSPETVAIKKTGRGRKT